MAEIGMNELHNALNKDQEIKPLSEINMKDCDNFWSDVFGKEISKETDDRISVERGKENKIDASRTTMESVKKFWDEVFSGPIETADEGDELNETEKKEGLTQEEKDIIKKETGWSNEIIDAIRSMDEYRIYKEAGLVEGEVNGKKCLMRTDINWDQKDQFGMTNRERVAEGYAPLDKNGKPIQLHHIGQHADSPLAELTFEEHRTGGNDKILHDKTKETEVHGEGNNWDNERMDYWRNRHPGGGE